MHLIRTSVLSIGGYRMNVRSNMVRCSYIRVPDKGGGWVRGREKWWIRIMVRWIWIWI